MQEERIEARVLAVSDAIGEFIEGWGFKSIHGRVWALLAAHRAPLPQNEIAERLGVSKALVSLAMAELAEYGLVTQTGDARVAPYTARMDVWSTITDVLRSREWMLIEKCRVALEAAVTEVEHAPSSRWDLGRLQLLLSMTEMAQAFLKAIIAIRVPPAPDAFVRWLAGATKVVRGLRNFTR